MYSDSDLRALFSEEDERLLLKLGVALSARSLPMVPKDEDALRAKAHRWLDQVRDKVCSSHKVRSAARSSDGFVIAAAIADAIGGAGAATAAVLIVKKGLEQYCKDSWT